MKKILPILLILMTSITAAESFSFENGIEAEVKGLNSEFNIKEINHSMERPIYQSFKVESDGFTHAELSFFITPSWLDRNEYELFKTGLIEKDTKFHKASGNFEDYKVNISEPGEYYITGYTTTVTAKGPNGECHEYLEKPENFTETEECEEEILKSEGAITLYVLAGLAVLTVLLIIYRKAISLLDRKLTSLTRELASRDRVDREKLDLAMKANEQASNGKHLRAFKTLLKIRFE